jgi:hypothetical protein
MQGRVWEFLVQLLQQFIDLADFGERFFRRHGHLPVSRFSSPCWVPACAPWRVARKSVPYLNALGGFLSVTFTSRAPKGSTATPV